MRRQIEDLCADDKRLIVLRSVLAFAMREVSGLDTPLPALAAAIDDAFEIADQAVREAVDDVVVQAARQGDLAGLN